MKLNNTGIILLAIAWVLWWGIEGYADEPPLIPSVFLNYDIPLNPDWQVWEKIPSVNIPLSSQIFESPKASALPKGRTTVREVQIKSVNNGKGIAFLMEWVDDTKNSEIQDIDEFSDAAALQFPAKDIKYNHAIPYFTMGNSGSMVNIWYWRADWEGKRTPSVEDLEAQGFGTLTHQDSQDVLGKGVWSDGK